MSGDLMHVLLIAGDTSIVAALQNSLSNPSGSNTAGKFIQVTHADLLTTGIEHLSHDPIDLVILCLRTQDHTTLYALNALYACAPRVPVLLLTRVDQQMTLCEVAPSSTLSWLTGESVMMGPPLERHLSQAIQHAQRAQQAQADRRAGDDHDVSDATSRSLIESEARYRDLFEQVPVGLYCTTPDGQLIDANPALVQMLGFPDRASLLKANVADLYVDADDRQREFDMLARDGVVRGIELRLRRQDGTILWAQDFVQAVHSPDGKVLYARGNLVEITARKEVDERLRYLSSHDMLTDLYNRAYFDEALARSDRADGIPSSVVIVDVDGLKRINDSRGHAAGDDLLRRTAMVLRRAVSNAGIVARIGGDEFAILLPGQDLASGRCVVECVREELAVHNAASDNHPLSLSIGVAAATPGESLERVMQRADYAMYEDKQQHRGGLGTHAVGPEDYVRISHREPIAHTQGSRFD